MEWKPLETGIFRLNRVRPGTPSSIPCVRRPAARYSGRVHHQHDDYGLLKNADAGQRIKVRFMGIDNQGITPIIMVGAR